MNIVTKAIDFDAAVARNRELISSLPQPKKNFRTWNPEKVAYEYATQSDNLTQF